MIKNFEEFKEYLNSVAIVVDDYSFIKIKENSLILTDDCIVNFSGKMGLARLYDLIKSPLIPYDQVEYRISKILEYKIK